MIGGDGSFVDVDESDEDDEVDAALLEGMPDFKAAVLPATLEAEAGPEAVEAVEAMVPEEGDLLLSSLTSAITSSLDDTDSTDDFRLTESVLWRKRN